MSTRDTDCKEKFDDLVEGTPRAADPTESRGRFEPQTMPAVRLPARGGPASETGILPAVRFTPEGDDRGDNQDASRTTAENNAVPVSEHVPNGADADQPLVLIVEDTVELARLLQLTLSRVNIRSIIETSGHQALARYFETKPDVVLLDLGLPDMTGWKVLDDIRESANGSGTMPYVIVISAYGDAANRLVGKLQNVHGYIVKPFTPEDVIAAVREVLSGKVG